MNALDSALRQAVVGQFPELREVELVDYKVRILAGNAGTDSITRVLVSSARGGREWTTVGVHANVIEASWQALVDALVYALGSGLGRGRRRPRPGHRSGSGRHARGADRSRRRSGVQTRKATPDATGQNRPPRRGRVRQRRRHRFGRRRPGRSPIIRSARRPTPAGRGRCRTPGCWRRSCRRRWSRSAGTTPTTPPSWATTLPSSPMIFLKPSTSVIGPNVAIALPAVVRAGGLRGRAGGGDRPPVPRRPGGERRLGHPRLHRRQRRHRPRPAAGRRAVHPGEGVRHLLPARAVDRNRARPCRISRCSTELDGVTVQDGRTSDMVFTVGEIVEFVSGIMTLLPGDVLLTGTPAGVGPMRGRAERVGDGGGHRDADQPGGRPPLTGAHRALLLTGHDRHSISTPAPPARSAPASARPRPGRRTSGMARTALFNWAFARHHGGTFVFRIEDTDAARDSEESYEALLDAMTWLGLDWDEGPGVGGPHAPYRQSQRADIYRAVAAELVAAGHLYESYSTADDVTARHLAVGPRSEARLRQLRPHTGSRADRGGRRGRPAAGAAAADARPRHRFRRPGPRPDHLPGRQRARPGARPRHRRAAVHAGEPGRRRG